VYKDLQETSDSYQLSNILPWMPLITVTSSVFISRNTFFTLSEIVFSVEIQMVHMRRYANFDEKIVLCSVSVTDFSVNFTMTLTTNTKLRYQKKETKTFFFFQFRDRKFVCFFTQLIQWFDEALLYFTLGLDLLNRVLRRKKNHKIYQINILAKYSK
jgi:hypothetical protein